MVLKEMFWFRWAWPSVGVAVEKGAVGFQNVMNSFFEGGNKFGPAAFKYHVSF